KLLLQQQLCLMMKMSPLLIPCIDPKDKGKGILQEPEPVKKTKKRDQDQIERDAKVTLKIQADLDDEVWTKRERQEEASKAALAGLYDESSLKEGRNSKKEQRSEEDEKGVRSRKKRASGLSLKQESSKKKKVNDQESIDSDKELRICLKLVPVDDKAINYKTLDVKSQIIDCESQKLGTIKAEDEKGVRSGKKRAAGLSLKQESSKKKVNDQESIDSDKELRICLKLVPVDDKAINYETLDVKSQIIDCESQKLGTIKAVLDRHDVLDLHKIFMERFSANDPEGYDLILWGDLKTLMESSKDDEI
nr:hypothetical protein [Tanacetum cinerariifolium]